MGPLVSSSSPVAVVEPKRPRPDETIRRKWILKIKSDLNNNKIQFHFHFNYFLLPKPNPPPPQLLPFSSILFNTK